MSTGAQITLHLLSVLLAIVGTLALVIYLDLPGNHMVPVVFDQNQAIISFMDATDGALSDDQFQARIAGFEQSIPKYLDALAKADKLVIMNREAVIGNVPDITPLIVRLGQGQ